MSNTPLKLRRGLAAGAVLSLLMMVARVAFYPKVFSLPFATILLATVVVLLLMYAIVALRTGSQALPTLRTEFATRLGLLGGLLQVVFLLVQLGNTLAPWNRILSSVLMLGTLVLWGYASFRASQTGLKLRSSCLVAAWSAVVTTIVAVSAAMLLGLFLVPLFQSAPPEKGAMKHPQLGPDKTAVSIANTIGDACTRLIFAPALGEVVGLVGGSLALFFPAPKSATQPGTQAPEIKVGEVLASPAEEPIGE